MSYEYDRITIQRVGNGVIVHPPQEAHATVDSRGTLVFTDPDEFHNWLTSTFWVDEPNPPMLPAHRMHPPR